MRDAGVTARGSGRGNIIGNRKYRKYDSSDIATKDDDNTIDRVRRSRDWGREELCWGMETRRVGGGQDRVGRPGCTVDGDTELIGNRRTRVGACWWLWCRSVSPTRIVTSGGVLALSVLAVDSAVSRMAVGSLVGANASFLNLPELVEMIKVSLA